MAVALWVTTAGAGSIDDVKEAYRRPADIPFPASNPYTFEKASLGKALFFDPRLSASQNMTCASCHNPSFGWQAPSRTAMGAKGKPMARRSPTILNVAWGKSFFVDGRAPTLENQARSPIENVNEMNLPLPEAVRRLQAVPAYVARFDIVFPGVGITSETVVQALATYERTVVGSYAPFDAWVAGDLTALAADAVQGFQIFTGRAGCSSCHSGWSFTDGAFHDVGLSPRDEGRGLAAGSAQYAFKTPTLRDVSLRGQFMHDGSLTTLSAVVDHYNSGGHARPSKSKLVRPLLLSDADKRALIAFLVSLTGEQPVIRLPVLPN